WMYGGDGKCQALGESARARTWPVQERFGNMFVFNGRHALFTLASVESTCDGEVRTRIREPVQLRCAWVAVVSNAFDMQHLSVVHGRALIETPVAEPLDPYRLRLCYRSSVTGRGLADRITKWLSGNEIRVTITCWGGTILTVESQVGRARTTMFMGIMPRGEEVIATPIFGIRKSKLPGWDRLKVRITAWLFSHFMRK